MHTAIFYRVDLHVHTIDSYDFPSIHQKNGFISKIPDEEIELKNNPELFKQRFTQRAKEQHLRLVAITDHNKSDIAEELTNLSDQEVTILPGIEISVKTNLFPESAVHIIGIFPEGTSSKEIDKVFPVDCGMPPSNKRVGGETTNQSISDVLLTIKHLNGLSIAAHVSSAKGIREMVHSQNVSWLKQNYLRNFLKERQKAGKITNDEIDLLQKLEIELKPLGNDIQNTYLNFLAEHEFNAIQIQQSDQEHFYSGIHVELLDLPPFSCILSTDTHTLADLGCQGHATHIKMTQVGVEGLRKAFLDPETRIRYDTNVPTKKPSRILGISFEGGSLDKQVIGFSDNLTTLIGGRGTGKSAAIEAIRFVLGQPINSLPDRLKKDIEERLNFTLRDTEVKLLFADDKTNSTIVVKRRISEEHPTCFSLDGKVLAEIELPNSRNIHAEIYGWNEIEALSDSSRKQLSLFDRTISGIDNLLLDKTKCYEKLKKNNNEVVSISREVKHLLSHVQGAGELRLELQKLNTPELNLAFTSFDKNEKALQALRRINKESETNRDFLLEKNQKRNLESGFLNLLKTSKDDLEQFPWFSDFNKSFKQEVKSIQTNYDNLLNTLDTLDTKINNIISSLEKERVIIEAQLNAIAEKSGQNDFKSALSRRKDLTQKLTEVEKYEKEIDAKEIKIAELLKLRKTEYVPNLRKARKILFSERNKKAISISQKLSELKAAKGVSIKIDHLQEVDEFSVALGQKSPKYEGLFKGIDKQYISKDYPGFYAKKFSPHEFIDLLLDDVSASNTLKILFVRKKGARSGEIARIIKGGVVTEGSKIIERDENGKEIYSASSIEYEIVEMTDTEKVWKHLSPKFVENEELLHFDPQKLENLLALDLIDIEDKPLISLDNRPIEELSPGQRCGALIPIILAEGNSPLIIDQPEDNLDNKMVFELVVDILRGLKEQRQIIVATHNPNIPVSGDAEQVVVFESQSKNVCCAVEQGSIDKDEIINQIKAIMEGGDKAFEVRMKKYGIHYK